jgi:hypothetical protein
MVRRDAPAGCHAVLAVLEHESAVAILDATDRRERIIALRQFVPVTASELFDPRVIDAFPRQRPPVADDPGQRHDTNL